ncbi:MAG: O-antigen ligase family protein, partial [Burkholderiales bacterium]
MFRRLAFWLLLFLVFTVPWEYLYRVDDMTMVSRAVGVVVAGAWALAALAAGRLRRPGSLLVLMALFVAWCLASIVWSVDSELSIRQAITYLQLLMLAVILWDLVQTERELRLTLQAYVLGSWVVVARLVETYLTGDVMRRFTVGEFNQNTLGLVLALALPMAWYLASSARARRAAGESDLTLYLSLPNLAFIPSALFAIFLTSSRAALLGGLLGLGYMALSLRHARWGWRLAAVGAAAVIAVYGWRFIPEQSLDRYSSTTTELSEGDWNGRLPIWEEGLRMIEDNWLVGVGARAFVTGAVQTGNAPHNLVISMLAELGLIGFGLFAAILGTAAALALRQPGTAAMWLTLLVVWFLNAITHNYEDKKVTWMLFMLIAIGAALRQTQSQRQPAPALHRAAAPAPAPAPAPALALASAEPELPHDARPIARTSAALSRST